MSEVSDAEKLKKIQADLASANEKIQSKIESIRECKNLVTDIKQLVVDLNGSIKKQRSSNRRNYKRS